MPDSPRVLVTGGAGFIGSALIWALNQRGCDTIVVADFLDDSEKWKNLSPLRFEDYLEADILAECLSRNPRALGNFSHIFHLGACSATTEKDGRYLIQNNYRYTVDLAQSALNLGSRFIYASSAATYGDGTRGMDDGSDRIEQLRPLNLYGYSKHLFDLYAKRNGYLGTIVGLKFFNVFGPNEDHKGEMRSLVNKAFHDILRSGRVALFRSENPDYADGCQRRDFLYVKDAVGMALHLGFDCNIGGLFNLGSGRAHTWLDLAHALFDACDRPPQIDFIDLPESLRGKYQYYTCANIERLRATGYKQEPTPLAEAVSDYVLNYLIPDRRLGDEQSSG